MRGENKRAGRGEKGKKKRHIWVFLSFPFGNELVNVEFKDALQETLLAELNAIKKKSESEN